MYFSFFFFHCLKNDYSLLEDNLNKHTEGFSVDVMTGAWLLLFPWWNDLTLRMEAVGHFMDYLSQLVQALSKFWKTLKGIQ